MGRPRLHHLDLPDRVYFRNGAYYYVDEAGRWTRLGKDCAAALAARDEVAASTAAAYGRQRRFPPHAEDWASAAASQAKRRSKARGQPCDLDTATVLAMYQRSGGTCELTGIPFDAEFGRGTFRARPWMPSIDRIDPKGPYIAENCRIVCYAVNSALNEYGLEVLMRVAKALVRARVFDTPRKNLPARRQNTATDQ